MSPVTRLPPPTARDRPAAMPAARGAVVRPPDRKPTPARTATKRRAKRGGRDRLRGGLFGTLALIFAGCALAGLVVRLTAADAFRPLAWAFYAASVPVLAVLTVAALVCWAFSKGLRLTFKRAALGFGIGVVLALYAAMFLFPDALFDNRPRVVTWNVARGALGWEGVAASLDKHDPSLAILVESDDDAGAEVPGEGGSTAFWKERFPDHFVARPGGAITVLSRGPLGRSQFTRLPGGGSLVVTSGKLGGERVVLVAVDLPADPLADRGAPLREIAAVAEALAADRPVIVAGDFNTPPDSVHFAALRRAGFVHAFEEYGRGYAATWPIPAPVLHLDHVWLSPGFDVGEAWHGWTAHSDHRPVLVPAQVNRDRFAAAWAAATRGVEE